MARVMRGCAARQPLALCQLLPSHPLEGGGGLAGVLSASHSYKYVLLRPKLPSSSTPQQQQHEAMAARRAAWSDQGLCPRYCHGRSAGPPWIHRRSAMRAPVAALRPRPMPARTAADAAACCFTAHAVHRLCGRRSVSSQTGSRSCTASDLLASASSYAVSADLAEVSQHSGTKAGPAHAATMEVYLCPLAASRASSLFARLTLTCGVLPLRAATGGGHPQRAEHGVPPQPGVPDGELLRMRGQRPGRDDSAQGRRTRTHGLHEGQLRQSHHAGAQPPAFPDGRAAP